MKAVPWKETSLMSERQRFVDAYLRGEDSLSEPCRRFGISRKTGAGAEALLALSAGNKSTPAYKSFAERVAGVRSCQRGQVFLLPNRARH